MKLKFFLDQTDIHTLMESLCVYDQISSLDSSYEPLERIPELLGRLRRGNDFLNQRLDYRYRIRSFFNGFFKKTGKKL